MADSVLLNIGNTNTQCAVWTDGRVGPSCQLLTPEFVATRGKGTPFDDQRDLPCMVACVVPAATAALQSWRDVRTLRFLEASLVRGIDFSPVDTATVGADRLANVVAALASETPPLIVLDCGTAVTMEVIDRDRRFRGGVIMPGRTMMRDSLHAGTGLLPCVELDDRLPCAIGRTTPDAMMAGINLGALGAVRQIVETARLELDAPCCPVLSVGGDSSFYAQHLPRVLQGPADFTLRGLGLVAEDLF